jgi:hypothetical protein
MRAKVEVKETYKMIVNIGDVLDLLKIFKTITHSFQSENFKTHALHEAKRRVYTACQDRAMTLQAPLERFRNMADVKEHCGGSLQEEGLLKEVMGDRDIEAIPAQEFAELGKQTRDLYLATAFTLSSDRTRYGKYIKDLENSYLRGNNKYPKTLYEVYSVLLY